MRISSLAVRITAWYDWLLIILILGFGAYTCKCLDYSLSAGVQNALAIRAREISTTFATTGQVPGRLGATGLRSNDPFAAVDQRVGPVPDFYGKSEANMVISGHVSRGPKPTAVAPGTVHGGGFLIATAGSRFGSKEYNVEVSASKKPIKAVFRQTAIRMLIGLVIGLVLATLGSLFFARRALAPVQKIALAVQALPVVQPEERDKEVAVLERIESLCVTVNEMFGQLEDSFQIGTGLPADVLDPAGNRLGALGGEPADMVENEHPPTGMAKTLLCLSKETVRLGDIARNLATLSDTHPRQIQTERLRFYLGGLAASGAEHICGLTKELGAELTSQARKRSDNAYSARW
jgi:hypothetical protein